jgi:hypothetical protein
MDYSDKEAMPPEPKWPTIEEPMPPEWMPPEYRRAAPREEMPPEYASSTPKEMMPPQPIDPNTGLPAKVETMPSERRGWSIDRIVDAVGPKHTPSDLDRNALETSIFISLRNYWAAVEYQSDKPKKDQINWLRQRISDVQQLAVEFKSDDAQKYVDRSTRKMVISWFEQLISACGATLYKLEWEDEWGPNWRQEIKAGLPRRTLTDHLKSRNPLDFLAGDFLPKTFETHFKRKPSTAKNGPYVRFVEQFLKEFCITNRGRPYARSTIVSALTDGRHGRVRRKPSALLHAASLPNIPPNILLKVKGFPDPDDDEDSPPF